MGNKKNKKKINAKKQGDGFPGYDLHITVLIIIGVMALSILKACK